MFVKKPKTFQTIMFYFLGAPNNFYRVNIDFFHKNKYTFLILTDNKSKWVEVKLMSEGTNIKETIVKLKQIFSAFGLPVEIVSDNGPPFNSFEFNAFCQANGINPVKSPPYHPQSNGIAERSVQTIKKGLEKSLFLEKGRDISKNTILNRLENFLFVHRNTPSTSTGVSPSESIFKFRPRTRFDLLKPALNKQKEIKSDIVRKVQLHCVNDIVWVKNVQTKLWQKAKIIRIMSHSTYLVQIGENIKFVHTGDIRKSTGNHVELSTNYIPKETINQSHSNTSIPIIINQKCHVPTTVIENADAPMQPSSICSDMNYQSPKDITTGTSVASNLTRSGRLVKPPVKLDL